VTDAWEAPGLLEAALEQLYNSVVITDADFEDQGPHVLICNQAFLDMTGYAADELVGRNLRILQGPDTDPAVIDRLRACLRGGRFFEGSTVNYRKDGTPYQVQWNISPLRDADGRITHFVSVQQDVSERVRAQSERDMLARALEVVGEAIMITDERHCIVHVNHAFTELTGYTMDDLRDQTPWVLFGGPGQEAVYESITSTIEQGLPVRQHVAISSRDGRILHTLHSVTPDQRQAGHGVRNISSFTDVTELVVAATDLQREASTDVLTGLANRRAGEAALNARLSSVASGGVLSIALCDIDHFKHVNDAYGHLSGDRVLQSVAGQLTQLVRGDDIAVRWGGEEFLLILAGATSEAAVSTAERVRAAIEATPDEEVGTVTISIGVTQVGTGDTPASVIERADQALYAAKSGGRNQVQVR
jgi:diguanylate cyclase (GGDEF)-like protein/PAS domain S-box-containing protein